MEPHSLANHILELSEPERTLTKPEQRRAVRLARALQKYAKTSVHELIRSHPGDPLMHVYMSDGWSAKLGTTNAKKVGSFVVVRRGKEKLEFLLQRSFVKMLHRDSSITYRHIISEMVGLKNGRKALNLFYGCL